MSVLVRGMEMPTKCSDCNFCVNGLTDETPMYECACQSGDMVSVLVDYKGEPFDFRPDWCPLVEVPTPHGRLIDADALRTEVFRHLSIKGEENLLPAEKSVFGHIIKAPAVIPAEGREE